MSQRSFRFVHASDLHLEQVPHGISEVPDHLRALFIDAPFQATQRLIDATLAHEADFLILSGDVISPSRTSPRAPLLLAEQLSRLSSRGIPVYWSIGTPDGPDAWPISVRLPENVHLFSHDFSEQYSFSRDGHDIARLLGVGSGHREPIAAGEFRADATGLFTIAVAHGSAEAADLQPRGVHYWALGGKHARSTLFSGEHAAHYPGTPQGRNPREPGPHGCTLVHVEPSAGSRLAFISTDVLRWHAERVVVDEQTTAAALEAMLAERRDALAQSAGEVELLVEWTIAGHGPIMAQLRRGTLSLDLLRTLRSGAAGPTSGVWSASLTADPLPVLDPQLYTQETILGDFLRIVRDLQTDPSLPLDLSSLLAHGEHDDELRPWGAFTDPEARHEVLRHAAALGLDLLSGEEALP